MTKLFRIDCGRVTIVNELSKRDFGFWVNVVNYNIMKEFKKFLKRKTRAEGVNEKESTIAIDRDGAVLNFAMNDKWNQELDVIVQFLIP